MKLIRKQKFKPPKIEDFYDKGTIEELCKMVEGALLANIKSQTQADGSPIKRNAISTQKRKRKLGIPQMSLADLGRRLVRGGKQTFVVVPHKRGKTLTSIEATLNKAELAPHRGDGASMSPYELGMEVQRAGYVGWFEVGPKALAAIREKIATKLMGKFMKRFGK